jgi:hypothetical protein
MKHIPHGIIRTLTVAAAALALCAALFSAAPARAQHMSWQTSQTSDPVVFLYPLQLNVTAGHPTPVSLTFRIANGLHINSHTPTSKTFIRTELILPTDPSTRLSSVDFPPGTPYALPAFPQDKLSVYAGEFAVQAKLTATRGNHMLHAKLRYQACATNSCYPPRTIPVNIDVIGK